MIPISIGSKSGKFGEVSREIMRAEATAALGKNNGRRLIFAKIKSEPIAAKSVAIRTINGARD